VFVSITGIIAYLPDNVPFHHRSKFLGDRDFFGECVAAARKRNIHVVGRMSPDLNFETRCRPIRMVHARQRGERTSQS